MAAWSRVRSEPQVNFAPLEFGQLNMTLHEHYQPRSTDTLVVFVHGLSGKGYETWGGFPKLVFESQASTVVDVAVFDYFSGKRRIFRVRPRAHLVANSLAQCIAEIQSKYTQIFLVAHSMGGLISKDAARIYLEKYDANRTLLKRLSGIVLFGCPQRGSRWAIPFFTPLVIEIKYLRNGSKYQRRLRKFFRENVDDTDLPQKGNRDFMIATYAASGDKDFVVTTKSAIADVFPRQCNNFRSNHRSLVKPTQAEHPQVTWLLNVIAKVPSIDRRFADSLPENGSKMLKMSAARGRARCSSPSSRRRTEHGAMPTLRWSLGLRRRLLK